MTQEVSTLYRQQNYKGDRVLIELTIEDFQMIFWEVKPGQNPIDFLKWSGEERRRSVAANKKACLSMLIFIIALFFLRRFIP